MRQKLRRLLLISLCAVLIAGSAPDAYVYTAAGAEETILEESAGENVEESPAEESDDPPVEIEPAPEPEPEMTPEPEITPEPAPEATLPAETPEAEPALTETPLPADAPIDSEPAVDYAETADHSPEFCEGYAMIVQSNAPAWDAAGADAETIARLSRGAVWVLSRTDAGARYDRLKVAFYPLNSDRSLSGCVRRSGRCRIRRYRAPPSAVAHRLRICAAERARSGNRSRAESIRSGRYAGGHPAHRSRSAGAGYGSDHRRARQNRCAHAGHDHHRP